MRIQKHLAYRYKNKEHYKHVLVIPEKAVETLGWQSGMELDDEVKGRTLLLKPKTAELDAESQPGIDSRPLRRSIASTKTEQHGKIALRKARTGT